MIEYKKTRVIKEDGVVGNTCSITEKTYKMGYDNFVYPYTVSFLDEGKYEVIIKGKHAIARKVE